MKTIGVFFGSRSPEHDISIITAQLIISTLKEMHHHVVPIYIDKEGRWLIDNKLGSLKTFTSGESLPNSFQEYYLDLENSHGKMVFKKKGFAGNEIKIDIAFPALHGSFGEDGTIQGLFELVQIPYVGCDVASSAVAMDKVFTKQICETNNIPTAPYVYSTRENWNLNNEIEIPFPVVVKPAHLGSSIGISKANNKEELKQALEVAFHFDDKVLIEKCIENLADITCCVLGNADKIETSELQESIFNKDIFSYEEKYLEDGGTQLGNATANIHIPARLEKNTTEDIKMTARKTFLALGCYGIARVDFLYDTKSQKYYVSEVNPLPGNLYKHLWEKSGMKLKEVLEKLLLMAQQREEDRKNRTYTFKSDILKYANSIKLQLKHGN